MKKVRKAMAMFSLETGEAKLPGIAGSYQGGSESASFNQGRIIEGDYGLMPVHEHPSAKVDVVFIHGLNGHWKESFAKDSIFWLKDYLPKDTDNRRIISYGYDARVKADIPISQQTIFDHEEDLVTKLVQMRKRTDSNQSTERPIIFIAHSLGGIVLKNALLCSHNATATHLAHHRSIKISTCGILFVGTPQQGVEGSEPIKLDKDHINMVKFNKRDADYWSIVDVLREMERDSYAVVDNKWSRERGVRRMDTFMPSFQVPFGKDAKFIFREDLQSETSELSRWVSRVKDHKVHARLALHGRGGAGKTALANEIAHQIRVSSPRTAVFWVSTTSRHQMEQDYMRIADHLCIPGRDSPQADKMRLVSNWLDRQSMDPWLLILDNADDSLMFFDPQTTGSEDELRQYIPQSPQGAVLVTTKNMKTAVAICDPDNIVDIPAMTSQQSLDLLQKRLGGQYATDPKVHELLDSLEYLPQAVTQASAFIKHNTIEVAEYLKIFKDPGEQAALMEEAYTDLRRDDRDVPNSVIATGVLSFEQIKREDPKAVEIMSLIGVIDRQRIPHSLLDEFTDYGRKDSMKAMGMLKGFKLLVPHESGQTYDMHRLVHITLQAWLRRTGLLISWQQKAVGLLARVFPVPQFENWRICAAFLHHADAVLKYPTQGDLNQRLQRASLLSKTGQSTIGKETILGLDHEDTLVSVEMLAWLLLHRAECDRSARLCLRAITSRERLIGKSHCITMDIVSGYGLLMRCLDHWAATKSMNNLALILIGRAEASKDMELLREAESMLRKALSIRGQVFGRTNPPTLHTANNLALALKELGELDEAENLFKSTLKAQEQLMGPSHPVTLACISNLGEVMESRGNYHKAESLYRVSFEGARAHLGPDHKWTKIISSNLQALLNKNGGVEDQAVGYLSKSCVI
ncbi:hypothetical protein PG985_016180 [Apiospora marii]|uniref:uncharacterized protein n=1 Tax=Apiospora marii TaxID=335849 RepID=UPI0031320EAB